MSLLDDANNRIKQERLREQEAERLRMRSFQPVDYTHYTVPVDNQVQALLTEFVQFMRSQGIAPIPCVMANCERIYKSGFFGETFVEIIHLFPSGFSALCKMTQYGYNTYIGLYYCERSSIIVNRLERVEQTLHDAITILYC